MKEQKLIETEGVMYETVILGSGYFSFGYAYTHKNTLIIEETQLADPHFFGELRGFELDCVRPTSKGGAELYDAFLNDGVLKDGRLAVNELESAFCRFIKGFEPEILLGSFCTDIEKTDEGYDITVCNNEGLSRVSAHRIIDTRQRGGRSINILLALKDGKMPNVGQIAPAFYGDRAVWSVEFEDETDVNKAKSLILDTYGSLLRECGARIITTSYRMFDKTAHEPIENELGIEEVDENVWNTPFDAFAKGELCK